MIKAGRELYDASRSKTRIEDQYANRDVLIGLCSNMAALSLDFGEYADAEMYASTTVRMYDYGSGGSGGDDDGDKQEQDEANAVDMMIMLMTPQIHSSQFHAFHHHHHPLRTLL